MKTKGLLFSVLILSSIFLGCKKDEENEVVQPTQPTELEISVVNSLGNKVSGATVILYDSETNYSNSSNPIGTKTTDSEGKVKFSNLESIRYFWSAEANCQDNSKGSNSTASSIKANHLNKTNTVLAQKLNTIVISSYESEAYYCFINDNYVATIDAGTDLVIENVEDGIYDIYLEEIDFIIEPIVYTGSVSPSCGSEEVINFGVK